MYLAPLYPKGTVPVGYEGENFKCLFPSHADAEKALKVEIHPFSKPCHCMPLQHTTAAAQLPESQQHCLEKGREST